MYILNDTHNLPSTYREEKRQQPFGLRHYYIKKRYPDKWEDSGN